MRLPSRTPQPVEPGEGGVIHAVSPHRFAEQVRAFLDMTGGKALTFELGQLLAVLEEGLPQVATVGQHQATVSYPEPLPESTAMELAARLGMKCSRAEGVDTLTPA